MASNLAKRLRSHQEAGGVRARSTWGHGPRLTAQFSRGSVNHNGHSTYYLLEESPPVKFPPLLGDANRLRRQLQLVRGIGPKTAQRLEAEGIVWVDELLETKRFQTEAKHVLRAIEARDAWELARRGASDWDLARLYEPEEFVFFDLETTGLCSTQPLFLVGLMYFERGKPHLKQFLARGFEEEIGALDAAADILVNRPVWVSYNGRAFDQPFLNGRLRYYLGNELRPGLHIDLLRHVRQHYTGLLPDCRLTTVERYLLDTYRVGDIPGYMIPQVYYEFVMDQEPALLEMVLLHNSRDLQTLVRLLGLLQTL